MSEVKLDDIVSLAKRRGFIFPSSEIYGGLAGVYDYGPLGVMLKHNIENLWWSSFVTAWDDMYPLDAAILMNKKVWEASGHATGFNDPMVECSNCHSRLRFDHLVDEGHKQVHKEIDAMESAPADKSSDKYRMAEPPHLIDYERMKAADPKLYKKIYKADLEPGLYSKDADLVFAKDHPDLALKHLKCPVCGKVGTMSEPKQFNMMFKTHIGPAADDDSISYLRPETAQGIFVNFKNVVDTFSPDLPFGIAQIGKAFRNEISPREWLFRLRELEQMEIEYFVDPKKWEESFEEWRKGSLSFFKKLGLDPKKVHELEVPAADRAHYSKRTIDFEYDFPFGRRELSGLAYRTDFDLKAHQEASGKNLEYRPKDGSKPFLPHVIEPSFGLDRAVLAALSAAYTEDEQAGEKRIFLKLPTDLAPIKVAVLPLVKNKPELTKKAREVYQMLKDELGNVMWVDSGNIGKNYRKMDEIGTPYCVTIDFDTLEDDTVTLRSRDTTQQERVKVKELLPRL